MYVATKLTNFLQVVQLSEHFFAVAETIRYIRTLLWVHISAKLSQKSTLKFNYIISFWGGVGNHKIESPRHPYRKVTPKVFAKLLGSLQP